MSVTVILAWLREFIPGLVSVGQRERLRGSCGAMIGIFIAGLATRAMLGGETLSSLMATISATASTRKYCSTHVGRLWQCSIDASSSSGTLL